MNQVKFCLQVIGGIVPIAIILKKLEILNDLTFKFCNEND